MSDTQGPYGEPDEQQPGGSGAGHGGWAPPPPPPGWASGDPASNPGTSGWPPPGGGNWPPPGGGGSGWAPQGGSGWTPQGGSGWAPQGGVWYPPGGGAGTPGGRGPYQWGGSGWSGWHYGQGPARPRRTLPGIVTAVLLVVAVLVGLGIGHGVWRSASSAASSAPSGSSGGFTNPFGFGNGGGLGSGGTGGSTRSLSGAAAKVADDLVDIDTQLSYQSAEAAGTGIVLTSDGYVLTNNHVIEQATSIKATDIANGQTYKATVVGYDRTNDVAVIKLQGASGLKTASIGNSSQVTVGEPVVGLGNAGGVGGTPSAASGQVVALNQSITAQDEANGTAEKLTGLIETNADIQPGDSGGALINNSGKVIGMDTAASTGFSFQTQGNQGVAIPINSAMTIAAQIRNGTATSTIHIGPTAFLGVEVVTSSAAFGTSGAVVQDAIPGGPAAQAGIGSGDVITSLGGHPITSPGDLTNVIEGYHPGDQVSVGFTTPAGQSQQVTVTLASGPPQ